MLSEPERRALDAIAAHMEDEDPAFCRKLDEQLDAAAHSRRRWLTVAAGTAVVLGLVAAVLGVLAFSLVLVFVGCLVAATSWGAIVVLQRGPLPRPAGGTSATGWTWA